MEKRMEEINKEVDMLKNKGETLLLEAIELQLKDITNAIKQLRKDKELSV